MKRFDTDGSAILIGGMKWTSKGEEPKYYQTPYGEVEVLRHVYQTSAGGKDLLSARAGGADCGDLYSAICQGGGE